MILSSHHEQVDPVDRHAGHLDHHRVGREGGQHGALHRQKGQPVDGGLGVGADVGHDHAAGMPDGREGTDGAEEADTADNREHGGGKGLL